MSEWPFGSSILFKILEGASDPSDPIVVCRFFSSREPVSWYATEFDDVDGIFYGVLQNGEERFWTHFLLEDLMNDPSVSFDREFVPQKASELGLPPKPGAPSRSGPFHLCL